ncbi:MAG: hypothetical protein MUF14_01530 [Hyphomonadaceae bacterium]|jgi:hypothetical protein|nr:hypothetical protein [Hyphomonadaceae bacterium]
MTQAQKTESALTRASRTGRVLLGVACMAALGTIGLSVMAANDTRATTAQLPSNRGVAQDAPVTAIPSRIPAGASQLGDAAFARFIGTGIWRAGACDGRGNFQKFSPADARVEVGAGHPGEGEALQVLAARRSGDLVEVETRVCAPEPIGCNQTFEQYKVLAEDRLQEWHFEGRLPGQEPYVLVRSGQASDGSGAGRIFTRCTG